MAGTVAGGKAAAATNKAVYGADFYKRLGAIGGKRGHTGGFYANRELARIAGTKGGHISKRGKAKPKTISIYNADWAVFNPKPSLWQRFKGLFS